MKIEKPSYYLKLNMSKCPRVVIVNGFEIERELKGRTSYSEYPINHYIKNGTNRIEMLVGKEVAMKKSTDHTSSCVAEIRVRGKIDNQRVEYKITDITYAPNYTDKKSDLYANSFKSGEYVFKSGDQIEEVKEGGDFSTGDITSGPIYFNGVGDSFGRDFTATVPFPEWMFFSGDSITTIPMQTDDQYDQVKSLIRPLVVDMWDLFEKEDVDKILPHFEARSAEIDQAFYKEAGSTQEELRRSIKNVYKQDYPLLRKEDGNLQLIVTYNEKLASIVNAGTRAGTVLYLDEETDSLTFYTIYWMKKDGKWIIAR